MSTFTTYNAALESLAVTGAPSDTQVEVGIAGIGFISGVRSMVFVDDSGINAGALTAKSIDKALGCLEISLKQKLQSN